MALQAERDKALVEKDAALASAATAAGEGQIAAPAADTAAVAELQKAKEAADAQVMELTKARDAALGKSKQVQDQALKQMEAHQVCHNFLRESHLSDFYYRRDLTL